MDNWEELVELVNLQQEGLVSWSLILFHKKVKQYYNHVKRNSNMEKTIIISRKLKLNPSSSLTRYKVSKEVNRASGGKSCPKALIVKV